jgi:hypothetical protein
MKLLVIAVLFFLGYKLVTANRGIQAAEKQDQIENDKEEFSEYEEVE